MPRKKKEVTENEVVKNVRDIPTLEDLPIETLSVYYGEIVRIVEQSNNNASLCRTSENAAEREMYSDFMKMSSEFNGYASRIDNIIQNKLREICGRS